MESETTTRKTRIDPRLKEAGWSVVPFRDLITSISQSLLSKALQGQIMRP